MGDVRAGWEAYESARDMYYRDPDFDDDFYALSIVTTGSETGYAVSDIAHARENHIEQQGDAIFRNVTIEPPKTDSGGVRTAVVYYCDDPSQLNLVNTETGEPVSRSKTLTAQVTMQLMPDGSWRAAGYQSRFEPC